MLSVSTNYASWSVAKLKREKSKIEKAIFQAEARDKKKAMAELVATARKNGFELKELLGSGSSGSATPRKKVAKKVAAKRGAKKGVKRGKVPPKYRNPDNKAETWTGRGKRPRWVQAWVDSGNSIDDVAI